jgi:mannosyltransferase OCH1-like enzyme
MGDLIDIMSKLEPIHGIGFRRDFITKNNRWSILNDLYIKHINKNGQNGGNIPKKIHQVWLGGKLPNKYNELIQTFKIHNPDWEFKIWGDDDIKEFGLDTDINFNKVTNLGSRSDILRCHILRKYGGLYTDTDFICVNNLDWLTNFDFVGGGFSVLPHKNHSPEIFNGLFAIAPNHPITNLYIKNVYNSININKGNILNETGPRFFTDIIFEVLNNNLNAIVLPMNYFYPFPGKNRFNRNNINQWIKPETLCVHLWYSSWQ